MAMDLSSDKIICYRCGKQFTKRQGNFLRCYSELYKGPSYLPYCKDCIDAMYNKYLALCEKPELAIRQMCRKLDLYWNESLCEKALNLSAIRTAMSKYLSIINGASYAGKSYDDSLLEDGTMWNFGKGEVVVQPMVEEETTEPEIEYDIPEEVKMFWGTGYSDAMYDALEQRRRYWMSKFPEDVELDIGTEAIIRQICSLELDINRDRADGKAVDKSINALNTLLGSANLKPVQKKEDADASLENTPLGVWLYRYEYKRPLPDEYKDSKILKYVFTWMGHVCRMLGVKNAYEQLYQDEIDRLRVEKPEYDGDDDEVLFSEYLNDDSE